MELAVGHVQCRVRERVRVSDVVVVTVGEDDVYDRCRVDSQFFESFARVDQQFTVPAPARLDAETGVHNDGPVAVSEDPEEVVHNSRPISFPVQVVVQVHVTSHGLAGSHPDRRDLVLFPAQNFREGPQPGSGAQDAPFPPS